MRVLFLIHDTAISGAALSLFNLLEGLRKKGVELYIAGPSPTIAYRDRIDIIGATYMEVHPVMSIMPPLKSFRNIIGFPRNYVRLLKKKRLYYFEIKKLVAEIQPKLIHTNVGTLHEGLKVAKEFGIPNIMHLREYQDLDFNWNFYPSKKLYEKMLHTTNVICISNDIKRYFGLEHYHSCRTIYNGILHENEATYISDKENYFMTASRISPEKGLSMTIEAFAGFSKLHGDYVLRIFGEGADIYKNELKTRAVELGVEDKVKFEGYKSNIPDYLSLATALIVSSRNEGFGRMSAEALIKGCALIGRNSGGTKEIMENVPSFPFEDVDGCINQMCRVVNLLQIREDNQLLGSQKIAKDLFSIEKNVEKIYEFYNDILSLSCE